MIETTPLTLRAVFVADDSGKRRGFTGARCELPNGQVVEVQGHRSPLYALARQLEAMGFGDWKLQAYTPASTPSLRGRVSVMAAMDVREGRHGPVRRKYRPGNLAEDPTQRDLGLGGSNPPEKAETRSGESLGGKEAA